MEAEIAVGEAVGAVAGVVDGVVMAEQDAVVKVDGSAGVPGVDSRRASEIDGEAVAAEDGGQDLRSAREA